MMNKAKVLTKAQVLIKACILVVSTTVVLQGAAVTSSLASASAAAKDNGAAQQTVTLNGLIAYALENNPRLKAARLKWKSKIEEYPQATSYDDPVLSYTHPIEKIETRLGPQERTVGLSQKIPFPGKLTLRGEIVKREIAIARTEYEKLRRDLIAEVKKAYYEIYYIDRATELAEENKAVLDYFFEVSKANYGLDVSELDELVRAEKLAAQASFDLIVLKDMREGAVSRLNILLNRDPAHTIPKVEEPVFKPLTHSPEELYSWAAKNYEALKIAGLKVEKNELSSRLSRYSYLPNFRVGLNYSEIGSPAMAVEDGGRDAVSATLGITIPIWFGKNRAAVRQSDIDRARTVIEKQAVTNEIQNEVRRVYYNLARAERLVKLYGESLVPEAKEALEFAEARYKTGKEMLGRILETQSLSISFRMVYYRALADYLKSVAELERLTAKELYQQP